MSWSCSVINAFRSWHRRDRRIDVAVLQRVAFFADVPGHSLVAVARLLEEAAFDAGVTIMDRGSVTSVAVGLLAGL